MRLLRLKFSNIHSLRGEHTIDFISPPLGETGIFAITGPTGAGKSTILDAITLALFGKISRLKDRSLSSTVINEFGGVVTRGQDEAYSQLVYQVGNDVFETTWLFRKGKKAMVLSRNGEAVSQGEQAVIAANQEVIGLNYDQFIRSVILPQGEFANFLKADSDERIKILERITGGEIYRNLGMLANSIRRDKENLLGQKRAEIEAIELLPDEELEKINKEIQEHKAKAAQLKQQLDQLNNLLSVKQRIQELEREIRQQQKQVDDVLAQKQAMKDDFFRLAMHEKLLRYKAEIQEFFYTKQQLDQLNKEINTVEKNISLLNQQIDQLHMKRQTVARDLEKINQDLEILRPKIARVRQLDTQIAQLKTKITTLAQHLAKLQSDADLTRRQIEDNQARLETYKDKFVQVSSWLATNQSLQKLVQDLAMINTQMDLYSNKGNDLKKKAQQLGYQVKDWQQLRRLLEDDLSAEKQFFQQSQAKLEQHRDFTQLANEIENQRKKLEVLNQLENKYQQLDQLQQKLRDLTAEKQAIATDLTGLEKLAKSQEERLLQLKKRYDDLAKEQQNQQEIIIFQRVRQQLKEGEPCPVCGSIHHPYKEHEFVQDTADYQKQLEELDQQIHDLEIQAADTQRKIASKSAILAEKNKQIEDLVKEHNGLQTQITEYQEVIGLEGLTAAQVKDAIHKTTELINSLSQQQALAQQLLEKKQTIKSLEDLLALLDEVQAIHSQLKAMLDPYTQYIPHGAKPKQIKEILAGLVTEYQDKEKLKTRLETEIKQLQSQITVLQDTLEKTQSEITTQQGQLDRLNKDQQQVIEQRRLLLGDKDPDTVLKNVEEDKRQHEKDLNFIEQQLTRTKTQIEEQTKLADKQRQRSKDLMQKVEQIEQDLVPRLNELDVSTIEEARDYFLTDEQYENLSKIKQNLDQRLVELNQAITERQQKVEELQKQDDSQVTLGGLQAQIKEINEKRDAVNQVIGSMQKMLEQNEKNKARQAQLQEEYKALEAEYLRWKALDDLIGNVDGTKFQRIAQEFSLLALLNAANTYLAKFNDRYQLSYQKHESNKKVQYSLFVVDNYLGGQQRSVNTLSGGESFLVSLSLAIGLSALASQRVKIENIFIDEGFGSLDASTLDQALAVLERFQSDTNRKIGIISHVLALKERIPVKIEVARVEQGFSKIQIVTR